MAEYDAWLHRQPEDSHEYHLNVLRTQAPWLLLGVPPGDVAARPDASSLVPLGGPAACCQAAANRHLDLLAASPAARPEASSLVLLGPAVRAADFGAQEEGQTPQSCSDSLHEQSFRQKGAAEGQVWHFNATSQEGFADQGGAGISGEGQESLGPSGTVRRQRVKKAKGMGQPGEASQGRDVASTVLEASGSWPSTQRQASPGWRRWCQA